MRQFILRFTRSPAGGNDLRREREGEGGKEGGREEREMRAVVLMGEQ